jgi:TRAP-type C4-dicarboxylate transport system permease small subunit
MNAAQSPDSAFERALAPVARASTVLAALGLFGMVITQGWQVLARYALNASPSWTEPLTLICLTTTLAFGFPLLVMLLPAAGQRAFARLSALIVIAIGLLLAVYGLQLGVDGLDVRLAGAPLPQGSVYFPLALGGALMSLFALPQLLRAPLENE